MSHLPSTLTDGAAPDITVRSGSGVGRTALAAFDRALHAVGASNFNLVTLSSVIPPGSDVRVVVDDLGGVHGDRLYCVLSAAHAEQPGEIVWAGLGWVRAPDTGAGLFVEHHAGSEESLREMIDLTLGDMVESRGGGYGEITAVVTSAHCVDRPVCALVLAAYSVVPWSSDAR